MEKEEESKVVLKLLVDEKKDQVVAAEAKVDFMDIFVSLLTLPLETIIRLIKAEAGVVGCMYNLYQSVENLDVEDLFIEHCKTMLLNPRNPYSKYCTRLKVNIDDSGSEKYYDCSGWTTRTYCSKRSYFMNVECSCEGGISYLISDDLQFKPASLTTLFQMLSNVGLSDMNQIKEMNVEVGRNEVIRLLARSFISKTPLSDVFLPKQKQRRAQVDIVTMSESGNLSSISENGTSNSTKKLELKLTVRKSTKKVLCAEADNDFIDFLFNFLTIPIGSIEDVLKGSSGLRCIDNFYKSVEALDSKWFNMPPKQNSYHSEDTSNDNFKTVLLKPNVATHYNSEYQLLQISEGKSEFYNLYDPRQHIRGSHVPKFRKFAKEPSAFYVMDNLEVRPLSSASTICLLQELNVPLNDIEEQMISVGESEALNLLRASLTSSSSALTEGLNHKLTQALNLIRTTTVATSYTTRNALLLVASRSESTQADRSTGSDTPEAEAEALAVQRIEEAIHRIIVRRSAPDWLPFRPGASYWVPPRRSSYGVADLVHKLANTLTEEEIMSLATFRGWPSSNFYLDNDECNVAKKEVQSEDEEV